MLTTSYPSNSADPSGHFVATEAQALVHAGHDVTVICGGGPLIAAGNPCVVRLVDHGACGWPGLIARLRERPSRAVGVLRWALNARAELLRRGPFDRLIAHWLVPAAFPVACSVVGNQHLEVVVHGSDARLVARLPRRIARALILALVQRDAQFRCVSTELADMIRALSGDHPELRIHVAASPIDVSPAPSRAPARQKLDIPESERLLIVVSRLIPEKRVCEALAAATLVPETLVVVLGDGPEAKLLRARFPEARFVGRTDHHRALTWIAAADVVISASRQEGAPTVIREARALGVPVVATQAGDLALWAEHDPGLWLVP